MEDAEIGREYQRLINETEMSVDEAGKEIYAWFMDETQDKDKPLILGFKKQVLSRSYPSHYSHKGRHVVVRLA